MVSTPSSGDIYRIGETIEFSATFNTEVEVEGTVNMGFYIGDQWKGSKLQARLRHQGPGLRIHCVQRGDSDNNGLTVLAGSEDSGWAGSGSIWSVLAPGHASGTEVTADLTLNSGTIKKGSDNAILTHDAIADNANHKVDGVRPTVSPRPSGQHHL